MTVSIQKKEKRIHLTIFQIDKRHFDTFDTYALSLYIDCILAAKTFIINCDREIL